MGLRGGQKQYSKAPSLPLAPRYREYVLSVLERAGLAEAVWRGPRLMPPGGGWLLEPLLSYLFQWPTSVM